MESVNIKCQKLGLHLKVMNRTYMSKYVARQPTFLDTNVRYRAIRGLLFLLCAFHVCLFTHNYMQHILHSFPVYPVPPVNHMFYLLSPLYISVLFLPCHPFTVVVVGTCHTLHATTNPSIYVTAYA